MFIENNEETSDLNDEVKNGEDEDDKMEEWTFGVRFTQVSKVKNAKKWKWNYQISKDWTFWTCDSLFCPSIL